MDHATVATLEHARNWNGLCTRHTGKTITVGNAQDFTMDRAQVRLSKESQWAIYKGIGLPKGSCIK
eukprot:1145397-Pelagomonas_calceolata.AAC.6